MDKTKLKVTKTLNRGHNLRQRSLNTSWIEGWAHEADYTV